MDTTERPDGAQKVRGLKTTKYFINCFPNKKTLENKGKEKRFEDKKKV